MNTTKIAIILVIFGAALLLIFLMQGCATGFPGSGDTKLREYRVPIRFVAEAGSYVTQ